MGKQAIAFILDASPSMATPYPNTTTQQQQQQDHDDVHVSQKMAADPQDTTTTKSTRFSIAKQVIENMIVSLMLQSVTNECTVILLNTPTTQHHKLPQVVVDTDTDEEEEEDKSIVEEGDDVPFPHLTELTNGVTRPSVTLLQQLAQVQPTSQDEWDRMSEGERGGDFISGLLLAADALYERTHKRRYSARKIVLFTDAAHPVHMPVTQVLTVVDALRNMQCTITVIGLDFEYCVSTVYDEPAAAPTPDPAHSSSLPSQGALDSKKRLRSKNGDTASAGAGSDGDDSSQHERDNVMSLDGGENDDEDEEADDQDDDDDDDDVVIYSQKSDRERLLLSLTEKTAGSVIAASQLHDILEAEKGKRIPVATRRKFTFNIAPGLSLQARNSLMMSKTASVTLKTKAVILDDNDNIPRHSASFANNNIHDDDMSGTTTNAIRVKRNALGEEMTDNVKAIVKYQDDDEPDDVVEDEYVTKAVRYGADLIPISAFDLEGLAHCAAKKDRLNEEFPLTNPRMDILGYMDRDKISPLHLMGPPYCISGHDSTRACAGIAALAQALHQSNKVAICTFFKTKTGNEPALGALFPVPLNSIHLLDDSKVGSTSRDDGMREVKTEDFGADRVSSSQSPRREPPYMHLVFLQLPFAGDVKKITLDPLEDFLAPGNANIGGKSQHNEAEADRQERSMEIVTDNLIDSLLLPPGVLTSGTVPSPFLRSWHQTKVKRAIHPEQNKDVLVTVRSTTTTATSDAANGKSVSLNAAGYGEDPMVTPAHVLQAAESALQDFYSTFQLQPVRTVSAANAAAAAKKQQQNGGKAGQKRVGKRALHFRDYLG